MKAQHYLLFFSSIFIISCDLASLKEADCKCDEIKVTKEESAKCEAFPEEKEKEIAQYGLLQKVKWDAVNSIIDDDHLSLVWPVWIRSCDAI